MLRPLYKTAAGEPRRRPPGGNAGLWFDKFCNTWRSSEQSWTMSAGEAGHNPKLDWLRTVSNGSAVGARQQVTELALRLARLVRRRGGRLRVFETASRFVTGLGRAHPVENGFAWHPVLGTPYLPGSSIKGLVRSWVREHARPTPDREVLDRLLGTAGFVGDVCFLDAVPTAPVRLETDVMTPHYAGWSGDDPAGDWRSPNPIPFLVTAAGTPFLFGILPRRALGEEDLDTVMKWVDSAVTWIGAGAKTAVGYGRYRRDGAELERLQSLLASEAEKREAEQRERERLAGMSPLERDLEEIARTQPKGQPAYLAWIRELKNGRWAEDPDQQREVAEKIKQEMERARMWRPTSTKKRPEKDRNHQRTLEVMRFLDR